MFRTAAKILPICFFVVACARPPTPLERMNALMKLGVAHDVEITVEPETEKVFDSEPTRTFACGRATINQPGLVDHITQRFIVSANKSLDSGLARFESYGEKSQDKEFIAMWDSHCPGHTFPSAAAATVSAPQPSTTNFDLSSSKVTPDQLSDPWAVIAALRPLPLTKGEFEKTDVYKARMNQIKNTTLFDNVQLNKAFAFDTKGTGSISYDADNEQLVYKHLTSGGEILGIRNLSANSEDKIDGDTLANLQRTFQAVYSTDLSFSEIANLDIVGMPPSYLTARVKIPAQRVEAIKDKIIVAYVGEIVSPYYREESFRPEGYRDISASVRLLICI